LYSKPNAKIGEKIPSLCSYLGRHINRANHHHGKTEYCAEEKQAIKSTETIDKGTTTPSDRTSSAFKYRGLRQHKETSKQTPQVTEIPKAAVARFENASHLDFDKEIEDILKNFTVNVSFSEKRRVHGSEVVEDRSIPTKVAKEIISRVKSADYVQTPKPGRSSSEMVLDWSVPMGAKSHHSAYSLEDHDIEAYGKQMNILCGNCSIWNSRSIKYKFMKN
jgi:hypothetical protein